MDSCFALLGLISTALVNGGAAHPDIYVRTSWDADVGHTKNIIKVTSKSDLEYACVLHVVVLKVSKFLCRSFYV